MHLRIDFYSKYEVSTEYFLDDLYLNNDKKFRSILLFSTYLIKTYINYGTHPVGKLLSVILKRLTTEELLELINGSYSFPNEEKMLAALFSDQISLSVDYHQLKSQILFPKPTFVPYRGSGAQSFLLKLSPCNLKIRGFGMFGLNTPFYAFHSIFASFQCLNLISQLDKDYLRIVCELNEIFSTIHQDGNFSVAIEPESLAYRFLQSRIN